MASGARDAGPAARLMERAERRPGRPWLFFRDLPDWRWHALGTVAARAAALAPTGGATGDDRRLTPDAVIADLGRQLAGKPVALRRGETRRRLDGPALGALADELDSRLAPVLASLRGRPIVVLGGRLDDPATRAVLAWATAHDAVLALEPDDDAWLDAAVWVRPHLALPPPAVAVEAVAEAMARLGRWNRLRAVLVPEGNLATEVAPAGMVAVPSELAWRRARPDDERAARGYNAGAGERPARP